MLLEGKVAVITGGGRARGIGRTTAKLFACHGARVAILDVDGKAAKQAADELGGLHKWWECDVTNADECRQVTADIASVFGNIDILFNNAGISQPVKLTEITGDDWTRIVSVSLTGTFNMMQATVPVMQKQGGGSIINMSSVSAQRGGGIFGGPHYSAAKAGILGLSKAAARELARDGIRVNAICPSLIDTDLTSGLMTDDKRKDIIAGIPMGRVGTADEVAGCVVFLGSALSSYVTGSEIDVNGGSHIH